MDGPFLLLYFFALSVFVMGGVLGYLMGWEGCETANKKRLKTSIEELEKMTLALNQAKAGANNSRTHLMVLLSLLGFRRSFLGRGL